MNKRDLEKDLEIFRNSKGGGNYTIYQFDGRMIAGHAIERAIQAEALVRELAEVLRDANGYIQHHTEYGHIPSPKEDIPLLVHTPGNIRSVLAKVMEVLGDEN